MQDLEAEGIHEEIKPLFFFLNPKNTSNIMVKIEKGREEEALGNIQKFYSFFNPGFPFTYRFLDQDYQELYAAEQRVAALSKYFAGLAILISCLGLFGLAAFTMGGMSIGSLSDVQETLAESADGVRDLDGRLGQAGEVADAAGNDAAELAGDGLLSWGMDPLPTPGSPPVSWRSWIAVMFT